MALPQRTNAELEKLLGESLPYASMQSLTVSLKEYDRIELSWAAQKHMDGGP